MCGLPGCVSLALVRPSRMGDTGSDGIGRANDRQNGMVAMVECGCTWRRGLQGGAAGASSSAIGSPSAALLPCPLKLLRGCYGIHGACGIPLLLLLLLLLLVLRDEGPGFNGPVYRYIT